MENNVYYCVLKDKYDSFYLLEHRVIPQSYYFGIQVTKKNIHSACLFYYEPSAFKSKLVSKQYFDSIMKIAQSARDDIISLVNSQQIIERKKQQGSKFFIRADNRIYVGNILQVFPDGGISYHSISIRTDDDYYDFSFESSSFLGFIEKEFEGYHLNDSSYDIIDKKALQTHQIIRALLMDKSSE